VPGRPIVPGGPVPRFCTFHCRRSSCESERRQFHFSPLPFRFFPAAGVSGDGAVDPPAETPHGGEGVLARRKDRDAEDARLRAATPRSWPPASLVRPGRCRRWHTGSSPLPRSPSKSATAAGSRQRQAGLPATPPTLATAPPTAASNCETHRSGQAENGAYQNRGRGQTPASTLPLLKARRAQIDPAVIVGGGLPANAPAVQCAPEAAPEPTRRPSP
jgi:hypothetical protein